MLILQAVAPTPAIRCSWIVAAAYSFQAAALSFRRRLLRAVVAAAFEGYTLIGPLTPCAPCVRPKYILILGRTRRSLLLLRFRGDGLEFVSALDAIFFISVLPFHDPLPRALQCNGDASKLES